MWRNSKESNSRDLAWELSVLYFPFRAPTPVEAERSAIIESCRRHGIEPYTYLHDVLRRLPSMINRQIKDIVPKAWAAARKNTALS